tara:strand:+ start:7546 stop:8196 length:651 start_codon:yes stop_codon:yes gene_type:complete
MSMRSQVYEWSNLQASPNQLRRTTADLPVAVTANREYDIFTGGLGNNITKPAETTATQFIVIEDIAASPVIQGAVQIRINTTDYFQNPDVTDMVGIPGLASPYPRGAPSTIDTSVTTAGVIGNENILKSFDLYPDVYVLPGQTFQILYSSEVGTTATSTEVVSCFLKYTLYDGPDALIANKLLELGVTINPNNVDWYKRSLIEQQQRSRAVAGGQA